MILLIVMICLAVVTLAAVIGIGVWRIRNEEGTARFFFLTPLCLAWFIGLLFGCFANVGANEVGIIYDDRYGVIDRTLGEGFHMKSFFEHVTTISTVNRDKLIETNAQTDDAQYASFQVSVTYAIEKENAHIFYKAVGGSEMIDDQLYALVEKNLQSNTINYNIFDLLSEQLETCRVSFESALRDDLFNEYGITLRYATFKDVDAGENVEAILQEKAEAEQRIEIARMEQERAAIENETAEQKAESEAKIAETLADAEAHAISVKGLAEGEAASAYVKAVVNMVDTLYVELNRCGNVVYETDAEGNPTEYIASYDAPATEVMTYSECSDIILSIVFYDSWNGELPETLTSDSLSALIGALIAGQSGGE